MRTIGVAALGAMLAACASASAATAGGEVVRIGAPDSPISGSVAVLADAELVYISGTVPDAVDPAAPAGSVARFGDTEAQTRSVLGKIETALAAHGLGLGDVVMMRVFLVAPPGKAQMDFGGMMRAYRERFGTAAQPNKPARSTMQVAGLVDPGWLAEIEVTAARARSTTRTP
ncbi:RidA family protein [Sphingomonas sp.]|uniref:RidA family protein n=1 Tax=Sphingomonas sp. TaxID=28214 RepID=UPI00286E292B|nr:RidA family protein [Sphingomonas sp.]